MHCFQTTGEANIFKSASPLGSESFRLERSGEDDCSTCTKMRHTWSKHFEHPSNMGSKGIRCNVSRGKAIGLYFGIHLNWHCYQSSSILHPSFTLARTHLHSSFAVHRHTVRMYLLNRALWDVRATLATLMQLHDFLDIFPQNEVSNLHPGLQCFVKAQRHRREMQRSGRIHVRFISM